MISCDIMTLHFPFPPRTLPDPPLIFDQYV